MGIETAFAHSGNVTWCIVLLENQLLTFINVSGRLEKLVLHHFEIFLSICYSFTHVNTFGHDCITRLANVLEDGSIVLFSIFDYIFQQ